MASNISEGSERGSDRDFVRFLRMANGSVAEVEVQAIIAMDIDCLDAAGAQPIIGQCQVVGRMITKLAAVLDTHV